jgi:hypothetical protein
MLLGEKLIKDSLVTPEGVEEALLAQALRGGRLGTNLVELGLLTEGALAQALGEQHNLPFAAGELQVDPDALARIGKRLADEKGVLPVKMASSRLPVAVLDPRDVAALDEVAHRAGRGVMPVVVPEICINRLLSKHCGTVRDERGGRWSLERPAPAPMSGPTFVERLEMAPAQADLIDERGFEELYIPTRNSRPLVAKPTDKVPDFPGRGRMFIA